MRRSGSRILCCAVIAACAGISAAADLPPANTGEIYVGEFRDDEVAVYTGDGTYLRSFTALGLDGPRGIVAMPDGTLYVASQITSLIYIFDEDEELKGVFSHAMLSGPHGMMAHGDELYVCSFLNNRVVVFGLDGGFRRWFTGGGMKGPTGIAADADGNVWVSSVRPPSVLKFAADGRLLDEFVPAGLVSPAGIARDRNGTMYVASSAVNVIIRMDVSGTPLGFLYHPDLVGPQEIAFDDRGHLFVSGYFHADLVAFDGIGEYSATIPVPTSETTRSLAFRRSRIGDIDDNGRIDFADMLYALTAWGPCPDLPAACREDVNGDGLVGFADILRILADWDAPEGREGGVGGGG